MIILLLLSILSVTLHACEQSRSETAQRDRETRASVQPQDEARNKDDDARAGRLHAASIAAIPVAPLTSPESLNEYTARLDELKFFILSAEQDALTHFPRSQRQVPVDPTLNRAKETLASGMITKARAELAMKDFEGARKTLRRVLVEFDSPVYGGLRRQAEATLQDVERAATLSQRQPRE